MVCKDKIDLSSLEQTVNVDLMTSGFQMWCSKKLIFICFLITVIRGKKLFKGLVINSDTF